MDLQAFGKLAGKRIAITIVFLFSMALASACVSDEETFMEENPPPPSFDTGETAPDIGLSSQTLDFGAVTLDSTSSQLNLTVSNSGTAGLTVSGVTITGTNADQFAATHNCAFVPTNGTCTISVSFAPTTEGTKNASLVIASSDPDQPTLTISLSGTGEIEGITDPLATVDFEDTSGNPDGITTSNSTEDPALNWGFDDSTQARGLVSAKSGAITDSQFSCIEYDSGLVVSRISFYRRVSSESCCDELVFYVDGVKILEWSGEQSWESVLYSTASGFHDFSWCYEKDDSISSGSDAAWIDYIQVD